MGTDFTVWASAKNAPLAVCDNPRIEGGDYPQGTNRGQFGWDVGIKYASLNILATSLEQQASARQGTKIRRLAICVHGDPGLVDIDGALPSTALTLLTQRPSEQEIHAKCLTF
jgi:hypothetical protein